MTVCEFVIPRDHLIIRHVSRDASHDHDSAHASVSCPKQKVIPESYWVLFQRNESPDIDNRVGTSCPFQMLAQTWDVNKGFRPVTGAVGHCHRQMTFRGFLQRDAGVYETMEDCHAASNVLLLTSINCSSPPTFATVSQLDALAPVGYSSRRVLLASRIVETPFCSGKKEKVIFSPGLHTVDQTFAERTESSTT